MYITRNFHRSELECPCCHEFIENKRAIDCLQKLRSEMGIPFEINSAYRCPRHNRAVGGGKNSRHKTGTAFDISILGWTGTRLHKMIRLASDPEFFNGQATGVGIYKTFIHFDIRPKIGAWVGD